ncbi:protein nessun dorma [Chironomus tepperi]|uniref:protein nessun dorma n=1 Tax=Chironomus tepperi TaxID=113505 RepID=UPI00391F8D48
MKIYTFEKSFQQRLEEFSLVLDESVCGSIKDKWKDFLETSVEGAGYKAVWKISKGMCEMLNITFPAEVFGEIKNTDFEDLTVDFLIEQVQDDNIQLPEVCQVPIEDVFPTIYQENDCLNVEVTADHFDRYRFFYHYIFLPFDADDDKTWMTKNLELRVKLFYDLKNKKLSKGISSYIRQIIAEVKYIQFKRDILSNSIDDNDTSIDEMKESSKETIAKLLDFHLRMNKIKHEIDILVNSEMREAYERVKFGRKQECNKQTFVISKNGTINEQMQLLEKLKGKVSSDTPITWMKNLCDAISCSTIDTEIYIPQGRYSFNFLDYLNNNLLFCGVEKLEQHLLSDYNNYSTLHSTDKAPMLFVIDGDMKFENLIIDCTNVKTGFCIKSGSVVLKNCLIFGLESKESTISEGFNISGDSSVVFENCVIKNFATALNVDDLTKIEFNNSRIENCNLGMDILGDHVKIDFNSSSIIDFVTYGILRYSGKFEKDFQKVIDVNNDEDLKSFNLNFTGDNKFSGDTSNMIKVMSKLSEDEIFEISDEEEMES